MNRRVLVTRATGGASALADALRALQLEPVLLPTIEIAAPTNSVPLDDALRQLGSFHWLLFTSANGVRAFAQRRAATDVPPAWPPQLRVAAIGTATARTAQGCALPVDLLPAQAVAESLAEALAPFARQVDGAPTRMLLVRAEEGREVLPGRLREAGAEVTLVPAYRNVTPAGSVEKVQSMFAQTAGLPAAVTFTSASTVRNLLALCESAGVTLPSELLRVSIGPITSEALREVGLPPHAEAPEATVASVAETVWRVLCAAEKKA